MSVSSALWEMIGAALVELLDRAELRFVAEVFLRPGHKFIVGHGKIERLTLGLRDMPRRIDEDFNPLPSGSEKYTDHAFPWHIGI